MAKWPANPKLIGTRITRLDGMAKASGRAKYPSDEKPQGLLFGVMLYSPYAHAKITSIDTAEAEKICAQGGLTRRRELLAPPYELVRRLFLQKAYQDGWRGVYFSFVMMAYRIATNMKAREISAGAGHQQVSEAYDALSESVADAVESAFATPPICVPHLAIGA